MTKKETVGKISSDLLAKEPESRDPIELQQSMQENYFSNLLECISNNQNNYQKHFFIVVITKNERLMPNVFRNYFYARKTCPTPDYDQTVWRYDKSSDELEYLWTIPSRDTAIHLKMHALEVAQDEKELLRFVLEFADGTLFKVAKHYNNEEADSPLLLGKS
jgi:hypothetical protein